MVTPLSRKDGKPVILMCPPDYFGLQYAINPWMNPADPVDLDKAKRQWDSLVAAITAAGAEVVTLSPVEGLPDLVFTANAAFVADDKALIAHYKPVERQPEEPHAQAWFESQGFTAIQPPPHLYFEGAGEALTWQPMTGQAKVFAAYGQRSDAASHRLLNELSGLQVLSFALPSERFYHIDVCVCPLDSGEVIYYPGSFTEEGRKLLEFHVSESDRIVVSDAEAGRFACNTVSIGETAIFNAGNDQLAAELRQRGLNPVQVDLSEFIKAGGSAKCLTLRVG